MIVLGLTGSIGMGKSATAAMFAEAGVPVYDADAAVHALYDPGGPAVAPLSTRFGEILDEAGGIDRGALRKAVLADAEAMAALEGIVHPLVGQSQIDFRQAAEKSGAPFVLLDIPLLFETGGDQRCDYVCVVSAPAAVQRARVLSRAGMTEADFEAILAKQMPDSEKRARADFLITSAFGFEFARAQVDAIIHLMHRLANEGQKGRD
ncbi:MAG: dephospho-CoA kinase [Pseudomonadota bacterium]